MFFRRYQKYFLTGLTSTHSSNLNHNPNPYCDNSNRSINTTTSLFSSTKYYDTLGISPSATQNDIKSAYYRLSMLYHPDKNKGSETAAQKFRDISEAYEVLGNYKTRKLYDKGNCHGHWLFQGHSRIENKITLYLFLFRNYSYSWPSICSCSRTF